jgi:hypothetical protein
MSVCFKILLDIDKYKLLCGNRSSKENSLNVAENYFENRRVTNFYSDIMTDDGLLPYDHRMHFLLEYYQNSKPSLPFLHYLNMCWASFED